MVSARERRDAASATADRHRHRRLALVALCKRCPALPPDVARALHVQTMLVADALEAQPWRVLARVTRRNADGYMVQRRLEENRTIRSSLEWERWLFWRRARHCFSEEEISRTFKASQATRPWKSLSKDVSKARGGGCKAASSSAATSASPSLYYAAVNCNCAHGTVDEVARLPLHPTPTAETRVNAEAMLRVVHANILPKCSGSQSWARVRDLLARTAAAHGQTHPLAADTWPPVAWRALALCGPFKIITDNAFKQLCTLGGEDLQLAKKLLSVTTIATLVSSRSCKLWAVDAQAQTLREVDAHAYASLQDVPVGRTTGIRAALSTFVSESERRAAVAQGAHAGVTAALTYKFLPGKRPGDSVSILELDAGISVGREGVEGMGFKQEAVFTAEAVEKCRVGFKRAWRPPPDSFPLWSHGEATKARIQRLDPPDMAWAGLRCAPWSSAQTVPPEGRTPSEERERALTEMHSIVTNLVAARPKCIILETAANAASLADWWPRIQSVVGSDPGYTWQWQVICPHVHLGRRVRRARLWMVGTPARQCTAASSSTH